MMATERANRLSLAIRSGNFLRRGEKLAARAGKVFGNGGLQPEAVASLLVGGYPVISDPKRSCAVFHA